MSNLIPYTHINPKLYPQSYCESLMNDFIKFLDVSPKTILTYTRALRQFFNYLKVNNIEIPTHDDILSFKKELKELKKKAATINLYLSSIRKFFTWCEQRGFIKNISQGVKSVYVDQGHKRDFVGATQLKEILEKMPRSTIIDKRNYAIVLLTVTTGLRTVEIVRADIGDLRSQGGIMTLSIQGKGRESKADFVKIPPETLEAINDYLHSRGEVSATEPLFTSTSYRNENGRLTTRSVSGYIKKALRNVGLDTPRLSAHSLRHSAVTLSIMAGHSLDEVQAFARHNSIQTTQIYSHAVNRLESTIESDIARMIFDSTEKGD